LRRRRLTFKRWMQESQVTSYRSVIDWCVLVGVLPPTEGEWNDALVSFQSAQIKIEAKAREEFNVKNGITQKRQKKTLPVIVVATNADEPCKADKTNIQPDKPTIPSVD
jgi:hypothetical protein